MIDLGARFASREGRKLSFESFLFSFFSAIYSNPSVGRLDVSVLWFFAVSTQWNYRRYDWYRLREKTELIRCYCTWEEWLDFLRPWSPWTPVVTSRRRNWETRSPPAPPPLTTSFLKKTKKKKKEINFEKSKREKKRTNFFRKHGEEIETKQEKRRREPRTKSKFEKPTYWASATRFHRNLEQREKREKWKTKKKRRLLGNTI